MTNTRFIGRPQTSSDSLTPVVGYKMLGLLRHSQTGTLSVLPVHRNSQSFQFSDVSVCERKRHEFDRCSCGFYAYKTIDEARHHLTASTGQPLPYRSSVFVAEVALSGRTVIAEHGYRAEHQRVTGLEAGPCFRCGHAGTCFNVLKSPKYSFMSIMMFDQLQASCSECVQDEVTAGELELQASYEGYKPVSVSFR